MESCATLVAESKAILKAHGSTECIREIHWIIAEVIGCSRAQLVAFPERRLTDGQVRRIRSMVRRRSEREPLQYILGHTVFRGLRIQVNNAVMIPRPETEQVAGAALKCMREVRNPRILDIGTGSGCLALALKHERPDAQVWACDISECALNVATRNVAELGLSVSVFQADIFSTRSVLGVRRNSFDLIVSNPPYVPYEEMPTLDDEVRCYEPWNALCAGRDPIRFYKRIARHMVPALLKNDGRLVVEIHAHQADTVRNVLLDGLFSDISVMQDLSGRPRIVIGKWDGNAGYIST